MCEPFALALRAVSLHPLTHKHGLRWGWQMLIESAGEVGVFIHRKAIQGAWVIPPAVFVA